jgi:septum site-determining protein MinD
MAYADAVSRLMGEQTEMRVLGPERRGLLQRLLWRTA